MGLCFLVGRILEPKPKSLSDLRQKSNPLGWLNDQGSAPQALNLPL